jgi:predicted phage terminase large subunit-like protein
MRVTAAAVEGFVRKFLLEDYAEATPIAPFHQEWWDLCCNAHPRVAIAAPRGHSKSTSINIGYSLATAMLGEHPFQIKVSRSHGIAVEFLRSVKEIISQNAKIAGTFRFRRFERDTEDDFIALFGNNYQVRMVAMGCEQYMRGFSWGTRRASLIICDDMEDDDQVLNPARREAAMRWFLNVLYPLGSSDVRMRVIGTFLHHKAMLKQFTESESWLSRVYEAHNDDFSRVLWPGMFNERRLREIQKTYSDLGNLIGYNGEYRNQTFDYSTGYFTPEDFYELSQEERDAPHTFYVGGDIAISTDKRADSTAFTIGGVDPTGYLDIFECRCGRWDGHQIIEEMFEIEEQYHPDRWFVETGGIWKGLLPALEMEQRKRGIFLNIKAMTPIKAKTARAKSLQSRMRAKAVRWDKETAWFQPMLSEMLQFRGEDEANDRTDSAAWLALGLSDMVQPMSIDEAEEDEVEREEDYALQMGGRGNNVSVPGW